MIKRLIYLGVLLVLNLFVVYGCNSSENETKNIKTPQITKSNTISLKQQNKKLNKQYIDLSDAAESTVKSVVHVKTLTRGARYFQGSLLDFYFGNGRVYEQRPQMGSGSGVIISKDGYIVTNNHVIDKADDIQVLLNDKRTFIGKVVGRDPETDIALIKIKANDLTPIQFANSDKIRLGEWVLAVGNPFNLNSTVTAGIISAKARELGILSDKMGIESFIQTDAAVNPGNSGGALVNAKGDLIGINTAIESPTGSYAGYSFAVPSNIVKDVVADLKATGKVNRVKLGVGIAQVNKDIAEYYGLASNFGVLITKLFRGGNAHSSGMKAGDIIIKINNKDVKTVSDLKLNLLGYKAGDFIKVLVKRGNQEKLLNINLRN